MVDEFVRNFRMRTYGQYDIELMNIDTREGASMARVYDIVQYPAIMVLQNDGYMQQFWQGDALPLIDEVVSYSRV